MSTLLTKLREQKPMKLKVQMLKKQRLEEKKIQDSKKIMVSSQIIYTNNNQEKESMSSIIKEINEISNSTVQRRRRKFNSSVDINKIEKYQRKGISQKNYQTQNSKVNKIPNLFFIILR